jgi:hypothetical protein
VIDASAAEIGGFFSQVSCGKQAMLTRQVSIVQTEYCPSAAQVAWAHAVVAAGRAYAQSGTGAFSFDDKMIDLPTLKQCETILTLAPPDMLASLEKSAPGTDGAAKAAEAEAKAKETEAKAKD